MDDTQYLQCMFSIKQVRLVKRLTKPDDICQNTLTGQDRLGDAQNHHSCCSVANKTLMHNPL